MELEHPADYNWIISNGSVMEGGDLVATLYGKNVEYTFPNGDFTWLMYTATVCFETGGAACMMVGRVVVNSPVELELTYPAGESPKVFTRGWTFGAKCLVNGVNMSEQVKWSGSGSFSPNVGSFSRPIFNGEGTNQITLSIESGGVEYKQDFQVEAVSPTNYAKVGDMAYAPAVGGGGCPACPHEVMGPILQGSSTVFIDGIPAARKGDIGTDAGSCVDRGFCIIDGDPDVLIDGKPAARFGDRTDHYGGYGYIMTPGTCYSYNAQKSSLTLGAVHINGANPNEEYKVVMEAEDLSLLIFRLVAYSISEAVSPIHSNLDPISGNINVPDLWSGYLTGNYADTGYYSFNMKHLGDLRFQLDSQTLQLRQLEDLAQDAFGD